MGLFEKIKKKIEEADANYALSLQNEFHKYIVTLPHPKSVLPGTGIEMDSGSIIRVQYILNDYNIPNNCCRCGDLYNGQNRKELTMKYQVESDFHQKYNPGSIFPQTYTVSYQIRKIEFPICDKCKKHWSEFGGPVVRIINDDKILFSNKEFAEQFSLMNDGKIEETIVDRLGRLPWERPKW